MQIIHDLENALFSDTYCVHLTKKEHAFMHDLLQDHPEVFGKIQATVEEIISDDKVDLHDIPKIVLLCSEIYHQHLILFLAQEIGVINLLRFTLDALIDSGLIPVPALLTCVVKGIVDVSLNLLAANVHIHSRPILPPPSTGTPPLPSTGTQMYRISTSKPKCGCTVS
uniref:Uncharacterized protein n=1 Tax=viral metagenome TaxID=1070528 RepID=A0A6C0HUV1_9ZZZZ